MGHELLQKIILFFITTVFFISCGEDDEGTEILPKDASVIADNLSNCEARFGGMVMCANGDLVFDFNIVRFGSVGPNTILITGEELNDDCLLAGIMSLTISPELGVQRLLAITDDVLEPRTVVYSDFEVDFILADFFPSEGNPATVEITRITNDTIEGTLEGVFFKQPNINPDINSPLPQRLEFLRADFIAVPGESIPEDISTKDFGNSIWPRKD